MDAPRTRTRKLTDALLSAAFVAAVCAPIADLFVRPDELRSTRVEFRDPAPRPTLEPTLKSALHFPASLDAYWQDTFGLRDKLIGAHNAIKLLGFGVTPSTEIVWGKNDWLYHAGYRALECDMGIHPFSANELDAWKRMLDARRAWLAQRGIQYLLVWVPAKSLVYPENLPNGWVKSGPSRMEQLIAKLGPEWAPDLLDLLPCQIAEKRFDRPELGDWTWFPLGTHWSARGAYAGYLEICAELARRFPGVEARPRDAVHFVLDEGSHGDSWAGRLYLEEELPQANWTLHPVGEWRAERRGRFRNRARTEHFIGQDAEAPRILVFHDSMGPPLRHLLAEQSSEYVSLWQFDFDTLRIEEAKPDIVIAVFSDRSLTFVAPRVTAIEAGETVSSAFARAGKVLLRYDAASNEPALHGQGEVELLPKDGALGVWTRSASDALLLPRFDAPEVGRAILHLKLTSARATKLDLLYKTRVDPTFSRKQCYQVELRSGDNDVYVELGADGLLGDVLMRPGREPGRFVIRALEIRTDESLAGS